MEIGSDKFSDILRRVYYKVGGCNNNKLLHNFIVLYLKYIVFDRLGCDVLLSRGKYCHFKSERVVSSKDRVIFDY